MYRKYKHYILGIALVAVLFVAYSIFFGNDDAAVLTTTDGSENPIEQELLASLLALRSIELNESVLSDPAFRSLHDFSQPLIPQPIGRNNPFAPIGGSQSAE